MLDAQVFKHVSRQTRTMVSNLSTNAQTFTDLEFAEKLQAYFDNSFGTNRATPKAPAVYRNLQLLGKKFAHSFGMLPSLSFLHGSIPYGEGNEFAERKVRQSRKSVAGDGSGMATQALKNAEDIPESGASMTELLVKSTRRQLREAYDCNEREALPYFPFVLDPTSFCKTVENIFHLSFLIKENFATIFIDDSGQPMVQPVKVAKHGSKTGDDHIKQVVVSLTLEEWEELVKIFKLKDKAPQIQHDLKALKAHSKRPKT